MKVIAVFLGVIVLGAAVTGCGSGAAPRSVAVKSPSPEAAATPQTTNATASADLYNGVSQSALKACLANGGNCESTVPGLAACVAAELQCNRAASEQRQQALRQAAVPLTKSTAESLAVGMSADPNKASVASTVTEAYSQLSAGSAGNLSATEPAGATVWVVLVNGSIMTDGSPGRPARLVNQYGVVFDTSTHSPIEVCLGGPC